MAAIAQQAYAPYVQRMDGRRPAPMDADYVAAVADSEAWVVDVDGEVIGFLVLVREGDGMLLDNVAVHPSRHGLGAGRLLLELAEARSAAAGCRRIRLYTHETMVEDQRLYERIGYLETHRATEQGMRRVFYEKALAD